MKFFIAAGTEYIHDLGVNKRIPVVPLDSHAQINLVQLILGYPVTQKSIVYDAKELYERALKFTEEQRFYDTAKSLGIKPLHLDSLIYREVAEIAVRAMNNNLQVLFMINYDDYEGCRAF